jgi:hypothetical protein
VAKARRPFTYRAFFRPDQLGALEKLDTGFNEQGCGFGYTQAYHKAPTDDIPFRIPSEYIASKLGQVLGLPIPPCALTRFGQQDIRLFSSYDFNFERASLVPVFGDIVVAKLPHLCAGVVVFDIWIGNEDRHDENVVVDRGDDPRHLHLFDHDHSLLSGMNYSGVERLAKLEKDLGITGKPPINNNRHVFLDELKSHEDLDFWIGRVQKVPDFMIDDLCDAAKSEIGIESNVASKLAFFLKQRRDGIGGLINNNHDEFTALPKREGTLPFSE